VIVLNLLSSYSGILGGVGGGEVPMVTDNVRLEKKLENTAVGARVILDCWNRGRRRCSIYPLRYRKMSIKGMSQLPGPRFAAYLRD
jgi:hypothetical protein